MRHRPDGDYKWIGHYMDHWAKMHFLFPFMRKSGAEVATNLRSQVFAYVGVNGRPRNPKCQGLIEQGNFMVEKLLGVRLHEHNKSTYPPWSEWLPLIQCKSELF